MNVRFVLSYDTNITLKSNIGGCQWGLLISE